MAKRGGFSGGMPGNMNNLMKQAQRMQRDVYKRQIAGKARELGIELFVLDDGWFGKRDDDTTSLGDWYPDLRKLPDGITGLAGKIRNMGMKFGLWFEPEMVSRDFPLKLNFQPSMLFHY